MVSLNRFEERLEVASAESIVVPALDHLEEERGAVFEWLRKDLEEVALVVVVDENSLTLDRVKIFLHLDIDVSEAGPQVVIVGVGDGLEENNATSLHALNRVDDVLCTHGDVLNAGAAIVLAELLDLTLPHAGRGLIDRHLDFLIEIGHDDGSQRGEIRVDHLVIDGPEAVEI